MRPLILLAASILGLLSCELESAAGTESSFRIATFSADITVPIGHRSMGIIPKKTDRLLDPLYAHGLVLLSDALPVVIVALDYCEVRNGAYQEWRQALATAAGTTVPRVLVCSLHQHDAPVVDTQAEEFLSSVGLGGEMCDVEFHRATVTRVAQALQDSLETAVTVTHFGIGQAKVEKIASTRRVVRSDGRVNYDRGSNSGSNPIYQEAAEGDIDPWLKTLSFWNGDEAVVALSSYAVHPMSYYGRGEISADFVGMARDRRQRDDFSVKQIYVSGCSGDVTAGKYNDGSPSNRPVLADRLYQGMRRAWEETVRVPLKQFEFRHTPLELEFHEGEEFTEQAMLQVLRDPAADISERILAAMGLSSLSRIQAGHTIDFPCLDFGEAQVLLFPGEAFVGYQLLAQKIGHSSFVQCIGYGECWPGYIPTRAAFEEEFGHGWRWVAPGAEARIQAVLEDLLLPE
ncbi:hypothetical protein [Aureliella helgolandensis]|uniref:Neutral/alkaline non-lysosomal ceramidase n=1 Tax=Aureliella helgolandensis TaxID=2527968 RepID=A0A518G163_9BACT|nr:hypothetical protein [Aureliella helgolandensis]QDV22337.1 hypothetical protein Q31a_06210 [Aureliella helgolandensis]